MTDQHSSTKNHDTAGTHQASGNRSTHQVKDAAHRAATEIEANPLGILAGGLAIGALAGTLIPRSAKEKEMLAPLGRRLSETAIRAAGAAREAGMRELDERGLTRSAAKDRGREMLDGLNKALSSAGQAAVSSAKGSENA